jgi:periplasmic protein TonB
VATPLKLTRNDLPEDHLGGNVFGSVLFHGMVVGALFGYAFLLQRSGHAWGDNAAPTSTIQATMVNSIPLPPRQPVNTDNVLTAEQPSPAPPMLKEEVAPPLDLKAIPIPEKHTKPPKVAPIPQPATPHPQPVKPQPQKATTGEAPGVRIAMSSTETRAGTVSVGTTDAAFGARYAYYVNQIKMKVSNQWYTSLLDANAHGHRVYIIFQIGRDGTPSNVRVQQPSGDPTLDQTALSAVQHIDTFGPLPDGYTGSYINVVYYFDPPPGP